VDAVLPWRSEAEEEPSLPPPVPPKNDLRESARSTAAASTDSIPERVTRSTPWLLRRVKTPVTQAIQTAPEPAPAPAPQKAYAGSTDNIRRCSPKPEPPAYRDHAVPQKQIHPSGERLAITSTTRGPAQAPPSPPTVVQSQRQYPQAVQVQVQVQPRTPPKPAVAAHRSTRGRAGETQRGSPTSQRHSGCPQIRSVRSAPHEYRSRRPETRALPPPLPLPSLRPVAAGQPERANLVLPSYHSAQPFPSPAPPPPPYRASAEDSYPTSVRSRSLPRSSRNKHGGGRTYEKEGVPLPPLPPLPLPSHPQLSSSAISRIQAGHKVSQQFGDAIMQQELRLATPTFDHHSRLDHVLPNPRHARRFLSASELQSHRKAKLRTDKVTLEHEAHQRASNNKSSPNIGRCLGDSRQRTVSAHPGRGQDKGSQRARR
jgi:hypothetical protein